MFKLYRYFFYQFYKLALRTEIQWSPEMRTPAFVANLTFSMYCMILSECFFLMIQHGSSDWLVALPGFGGLLIFCVNYFVLIKTDLIKTDKIEFDNVNDKIKNIRKMIFVSTIILTILIFILELNFIHHKSVKSYFENSKKIKIGATSQDVIQTMGHYHQAMISPENLTDSLYYYDIDYNGFSGIEFNFDKNTKQIKRINYLE